jgi:hypothetical protein
MVPGGLVRKGKLTINSGAKVMRSARPYVSSTFSNINGGVATATTLLTVHDDVLVVEIT